MIAISAAASSRSRLRLRSFSGSNDDYSASSSSSSSSHQRRHSRSFCPESRDRLRPKRTPPAEHTRAISGIESGYPCRAHILHPVSEEQYAQAMAARARLDARLRTGVMRTSKAVNSGSAPSLNGDSSTCRDVQKLRTEASSATLSCELRDVHTTPTTQVAAKSKLCLSGSKQPSSVEQVQRGFSESEECSICLESLSRGKVLLCWPCKHMFHDTCLMTWMKAHLQCPNCRSRVLKLGYLQSSPVTSTEMLSSLCDIKPGINVDILSTPSRHTGRTAQRTTIL